MQGIVGFGETALELQSQTARRTATTVRFASTAGFGDVSTTAWTEAGGSAIVELRRMPGATFSNYATRVTGEGPLDARARTRWSGGAEAVAEAAPMGRSLVLPLFARDVYSHTTLLWIQNTDDAAPAEVEAQMFDATGAPSGSWTFSIPAGLAGMVDPLYYFEFENLPVNAVTGFLGGLRFESSVPIAVQAYGDEPQGRGAAAFVAQPVEAAGAVRLLPLVRAGPDGYSLIAVTNVAGEAVDVTIDYVAGTDNPSGPAQRFQQAFRVAARSSAFVDLDLARHRGNRPAPSLPRAGFAGSATVTSTGPVAVTVLDQARAGRVDPSGYWPTVLASFAYNGLDRAAAGSLHALPHVFDSLEGRTTQIVAQNPSDAPVAVQVDLRGLDGSALGGSGPLSVGGGSSVAWSVRLPRPGEASAVVRSSGPVAVLALDGGPDVDWTAYSAVALPADLGNLPTPEAPPTPTPGPTASAAPHPFRIALPRTGR